ncbi:hypothetical protein HZS_6818 [Henneguya salminicola]|nr:hypothetical protein HZS_6818 [Henneguya salminicola]
MKILLYINIFFQFLSVFHLQKYDPCIDRYTQCKKWREQNMCSMTNYREYMIQTCPESCSYCNGSQALVGGPEKNTSDQLPHSPSYYPENDRNMANQSTSSIYHGYEKQPSENTSSDKVGPYVTTLPQTMRLIQSLTQMISQTAAKEAEYTRSNNFNARSTHQERSRKKHNLETKSRKKGTYVIPMSRRADVDSNDEPNEIDANDNTLRMIIQNKKRSDVHKNNFNKHHKIHNSNKKIKKNIQTKEPKIKQNNHMKKKEEFTNTVTTKKSPGENNKANSIKEENGVSKSGKGEDYTYEEPTNTQETSDSTFAPSIMPLSSGSNSLSPSPLSSPSSPVTAMNSITATTTPEETTSPVEDVTNGNPETQCETDDCGTKYSIILKQIYDSDFCDTTSSKFSILKGNLVQDLEYVLGSDTTISELEFEKTSENDNSMTKAYFIISGDLSNLDKLTDLVDKGNVNGLLVKPFSLEKE